MQTCYFPGYKLEHPGLLAAGVLVSIPGRPDYEDSVKRAGIHDRL
ncbi:hypothetical protein ACFW4D_02710 [Paenibacillus lactis]